MHGQFLNKIEFSNQNVMKGLNCDILTKAESLRIDTITSSCLN